MKAAQAISREFLIGRRIRECREDKGMTQEELGRKLGYNKSTIQRYETGLISSLKIPVLHAIANALNVNPDYLALKSDDKTPKTINAYDLGPTVKTGGKSTLRWYTVDLDNSALDNSALDKEGQSAFQIMFDYVTHIKQNSEKELSDQEKEMMKVFRQLSEKQQKLLIDNAKMLAEANKTEKE
jgi:transcriptional regulator with XRE-family HTH domain